MEVRNPGLALSTKVIEATHDISVIGDQSITGVGFQPKAAIMIATEPTGDSMSIGYSDGTDEYETHAYDNSGTPGFGVATALNRIYNSGATSYAQATLKSFDSDGLTITWSKSGTPSGTSTIRFICLGN